MSTTAHDLAWAAKQSMDELRKHGREPWRIRLHPLDAETIIADRFPEAARDGYRLDRFMGLRVIIDSGHHLGEPMAEFKP